MSSPAGSPPSPHRRPTLRDVAALANVSVMTVSNVMRGQFDLMTPATRGRVEAAMREIGYHPNQTARGLRRSRVQTLGFLVLDQSPSFLADPLTALIVAGMGDVARDADHSVLIQAERPLAEHRALLRPLLEGRVDAAALLMSGDPALRRRYVQELGELGAPFVVFDEVIDDPRVLGVRSTEREAARALTELLLARGHERIAFIAAEVPWPVIEQRHLGYRDALAEAGLDPRPGHELFQATWQAEGGRLMAAKLLAIDTNRPTAIMCTSDLLAVAAIRAAREAGMRVPDDVAITGFDDFEFSEHVDPPLTTVRVPGYEMGRTAARMLIASLQGEPPEQPHAVLESEVVVRASA